MPNIFEKSHMIDNDFDFIKDKIDDMFVIEDNRRSKVIFGFNGIGKSTIMKCIRKYSNNARIEYLEYINDSAYLRTKNKTIISANINLIETLRQKIENLKASFGIKDALRKTFTMKQGDANAIGPRISDAFRNEVFNGFVKSRNEINDVSSLIGQIPKGVFYSSFPKLQSITSVNDEIYKENKSILFNALNYLNEIVEVTDNVCPVCDSPILDIKSRIQVKLSILNQIKSEVISDYKKSNLSIDHNSLNNIIQAFTLLQGDIDLKSDFLLCAGDVQKYDVMQRDFPLLQQKITQLNTLSIQATQLFSNLQREEPRFRKDFIRYFHVDNGKIEFNSNSHSISIEFPRDVKTYSIGENNLITFLVKIYSFLGSEKEILLLDDPVSSLDMINHYKIAFEIIKAARNPNKYLIVLTHSTELLNVVQSQYPNFFEYFYIDEDSTKLLIQPINTSGNSNVISLDRLNDEFIRALITKDQSPSTSSIHNLFHYTIIEHFESMYSFSNHSLMQLIDNPTIVVGSFDNNSLQKIKYMSALRIWIEKHLFDLIPLADHVSQNQFLNLFTLSEKIGFILPSSGSSQFSLPTNLNRDSLMSLKTMLNQANHYQSQVMPLAYAINISMKNLIDEISEIKTLFI